MREPEPESREPISWRGSSKRSDGWSSGRCCFPLLFRESSSKLGRAGRLSHGGCRMVSQQGMASSLASTRRVAVIGAGVSGLAAAKCLRDEGLEPVVFEQAQQIGGLWNYDEALPDGGGVMYRALRTNTSKQTLAFYDFPLPETAPDFPNSRCV